MPFDIDAILEKGKIINQKAYDIHGVDIRCKTILVPAWGKYIVYSLVYIDGELYKATRLKVMEEED